MDSDLNGTKQYSSMVVVKAQKYFNAQAHTITQIRREKLYI